MSTSTSDSTISEQIRASEKTRKPVETRLATDEQVLARITDGIYRQPASALRELISNAYDADATEVIIQTDAPRFGEISVRDNGRGLTPEILQHLIKHIGGSAKRTKEGTSLGVTAATNNELSPAGRKLIGKMGIGLFSVAQFTRHFLIITKVKGDQYRTITDITLGPVAGQQKLLDLDQSGQRKIENGSARIWREYAEDVDSQGTEIKLLDLLPRTRAELESSDLWARVEFEKDDPDPNKTIAPKWHIGRMAPKQSSLLATEPSLPWSDSEEATTRFPKLVDAIRSAVETDSESVDLDEICDRYLQTIWNLALAAPLQYLEGHPFDLSANDDVIYFELENSSKGQAKRLRLTGSETPRNALKLLTKEHGPLPFDVYVDGVKLYRPILYKDLPKTKTALQTPLLFIGRDTQRFDRKPVELSGGPLVFEAYLFWAPKIIPKQHQGVVLRVGNASGALFDRTFMGYQTSELTRTRQITAEIYVHEGLDGAINIDRESFNYAHPHYQYILKWLHSAIRQLANRQKELGKVLRTEKITARGAEVRAQLDEKVEVSLRNRGVEDVADVVFVDDKQPAIESKRLRSQGSIVLRRDLVVPHSSTRKTTNDGERRKIAEKKATAIAQLLQGWGLLENLSYADQELLLRDIMDIVLLEDV